MGAADIAARLREQADALEREGELEAELAEAKAGYRDNLDDPDAKQRLHDARRAINEVRQLRRGDSVTVGGDAVQSDGNEG